MANCPGVDAFPVEMPLINTNSLTCGSMRLFFCTLLQEAAEVRCHSVSAQASALESMALLAVDKSLDD